MAIIFTFSFLLLLLCSGLQVLVTKGQGNLVSVEMAEQRLVGLDVHVQVHAYACLTLLNCFKCFKLSVVQCARGCLEEINH